MQVALLVATGLAALANWWSRFHHSDRVEAWAKPLTTMLVIGLALANDSPTGQVATAVIALALCLEGDIALMPAVDKFVVGLASFLLGHLVFIVLFAQYGMDHAVLANHRVLASVSRGYPRLAGSLITCYSPVRHSTHLAAFAFDLHASSTPPTFVLKGARQCSVGFRSR